MGEGDIPLGPLTNSTYSMHGQRRATPSFMRSARTTAAVTSPSRSSPLRRGSRYSDSPGEDTRRLLEPSDELYDGDDDDDANEQTRLTSRESIRNERPGNKVCYFT